MTNSPHLRKACELVFEVARQGLELDPSIEPPSSLRSFLYLDKLPKRALNLAKEAIEKDSDFRIRVADQANEFDIGRPGYLWLNRPDEWKMEFDNLITNSDEESQDPLSRMVGDSTGGTGEMEDPVATYIGEVPTKPPAEFGLDSETETNQHSFGQKSTSGDIKNELSSLRGLVDRLAGERELIAQTAEAADLSAYNAELEDLERRIVDVETKVKNSSNTVKESKQLSAALSRQVELERELSETIEVRSKLENKLSDAQVELKDKEDKFSRAETARENAELSLEDANSKLETLDRDNSSLKEDHTAMQIERNEAVAKLTEIDRLAGGVDIGTLQKDNRLLAERAFEAESEITKIKARLESVESELVAEKADASALRTEKTELSLRYSEAETALENATLGLETYKADTRKAVTNNDQLRSQVDELLSQVDGLQASLSEALSDLGRVRSEADGDRNAFRRMRAERDALLARVSEVEQVDQVNVRSLKELEAERLKLLERQEELVNERGRLKGETAAAQRENDQLASRLQLLQDKIEPLENKMLLEKRRVEELSVNLLEANNERTKISEDIKKIQNDQAQIDANSPGFGEKDLSTLETYSRENTTDQVQAIEAQLESLKAELTKSEDSRKELESELSNNVSAKKPSIPVVADSLMDDSRQNSNSVSSNGKSETSISSSVWDQDWPPGSDDDFGEFTLSEDSTTSGTYLTDFPSSTPFTKDSEDIDIDEISELLSRTVTDFQAITDSSSSYDAPPTVFDSESKTWVTEDADKDKPSANVSYVEEEIGALQNAVSAEDAVLLVDGDAVASLGWSRLSIEEQRSSLVSFLAHISEEFGVSAQVVFDGKFAGQESLPHSRLVRIRLSHPPTSTGAVIEELLETSPDTWPCVVIADNPSIIQNSRSRGASVFNNEQLLDFINLIAAK